MGKRDNLLLSGSSGSGKTTLLRSLSAWYVSEVLEEYNYTPIAHVDAIDGDRTEKALLQSIVLCFGASSKLEKPPIFLIGHISGLFQSCLTEYLLIDELEHLRTKIQKRRVLEITNNTTGVNVVGASVNSLVFRDGDDEIAGRFKCHYQLKPYRRDPDAKDEQDRNRLGPLLSMAELIIPLPEPSYLSSYEIDVVNGKSIEKRVGPAACIENLTNGNLYDIMLLLTKTARNAIKADEPRITTKMLEDTWYRDIRSDDQNPDRKAPK